VDALLPTMFSKTTPRETVDDFRATMQAFHPRGFRAMAGASAEDVRDVLPRVDVPTLLLYGDRDVRAPLTVAEALQAAISRSNLVLLLPRSSLQHRSARRVQRRSPGLPL
jgi:pimeloyl-ACP methyl ester carboxylesterase